MFSSISTVASKHATPSHGHKRSSSGGSFFDEPVVPIPMAQECFETSSHPRPRHDAHNGTRLSRVRLAKDLSPQHQPAQYFVRTAGGMSISVPEFPPEPTMADKEQLELTPSDPVPQLEGDEVMQNDTTVGAMSRSAQRSQTYLPLSVELVAGRGQTSMPADGNKNTPGAKVKSLPPSHTLAMSASFIKNYFSSGPEKQQSKSAGSTPDTETSVKTKMMGLWNNVKYGWTVNLKTNFSRDAPVYLLGRVYHKSFSDIDDADEDMSQHGMDAFKRHFHSLVWCTYRRQFPTLQDSTLTTDCGWGCMLRSGQMMLAQALIRHFLTVDWRYDKQLTGGRDADLHRSIVRWFGDSPSPHCPLSLHNLVHFGQRLGKKAGDWYGPASVAYIFKEAVEMGSKYIPDLQRVCVYVAQDCAVYIQDVLDLCNTSCICNTGQLLRPRDARRTQSANSLSDSQCTPRGHQDTNGLRNLNISSDSAYSIKGESSPYVSFRDLKCDKEPVGEAVEACARCDNWRSVLVMVPVRLGGEGLNPIYAPCLYSLFTHDLCIGIIGGRPKHSLYFVGFQEESLIHLDPHLCQDAVEVTQQVFAVSSYHCSSPRKMALSRMDPSATLGFYCHARTDFLRLMEQLPEMVTPKEPGFEYPIFEFLDGRCEDADACTRQVSTEDKMAASLPRDTPLLPQDSEEFVFL